MIKFFLLGLFSSISLFVTAQADYKFAITYSQPRVIKSPGFVIGIGDKHGIIQLSLSSYRHTPIPNQTTNSVDVKSKGIYHSGLAYLFPFEVKKVSIAVGAGISLITGPRYYIVDYYQAGGYYIYRLDNKITPSTNVNLDLSYKKIYVFSAYSIKIKNLRFGIGVHLRTRKKTN